MERLCLQLECSLSADWVELVKLRGVVAGLHSEIRWSTLSRASTVELVEKV